MRLVNFNSMRTFVFFLLLFNTSLSFSEINAERATATYFNSIQNQPKKLSAFLWTMPKGGDLHNHLGGASLAENMLVYARQEGLCINAKSFAVKKDSSCAKPYCVSQIQTFPCIYNQVIDAWSMRNFRPGKETGHDHFFATFEKFLPILIEHRPEMIREVIEQACHQNLLYVELMVTPDNNRSGLLARQWAWDPDLNRLRKRLLNKGVISIVKAMSQQFDFYQKQVQIFFDEQGKQICPYFKLRYLYQVFREQPPAQVFAQLLTGFELASHDPRVLGINLVQAEDGKIAMRDYHLQMRMIEFLHHQYPHVKISLHAGELVPGLVPLNGLRFHIHEAIEIAHASRIGHGVSISYEDNAQQLLQEMAKKQIAVEINLSSNAAILNVRGKQHPILLYRRYQVPLVLSTDDEGVLRTNLTEQFKQAVKDYHFSYFFLKQLVRNSINFSFLPGENLWRDERYQQPIPACKASLIHGELTSQCRRFLKKSEKADSQWKLEQQFLTFEQSFLKPKCNHREMSDSKSIYNE